MFEVVSAGICLLSSVASSHYHVIYFTNEIYHKHFSWHLLCSTELREVPVEYEMCSTLPKCSTKLPSRIRPMSHILVECHVKLNLTRHSVTKNINIMHMSERGMCVHLVPSVINYEMFAVS